MLSWHEKAESILNWLFQSAKIVWAITSRENVQFVSINDQFDTTNGINNKDKSAYIQSRTRIPLINLFNKQVFMETKMKVEVVLDMKAQHGEFMWPRASFGYQKSNENPNQLVPN